MQGEKRHESVDRPKAHGRAELGNGEEVLQSLLRQGILRVLRKPLGGTKRRSMFLIDRTSVEALQQEWSALIPLDIVAKSVLGVTKAVVLSLEQAGMLTPRRGPHQDGYKVRLYSQADIMQFEKLMLPHVRRFSEPPTNALPLPKPS